MRNERVPLLVLGNDYGADLKWHGRNHDRQN